jgi:RNA polymerase sigma factor (sigma-70 family)
MQSKRHREELRALADNLPFRGVDHDDFRRPDFVPEQIRQVRTYVRAESGMQAIGRFLIERGTVDLLTAEHTQSLFTEIHWCAFRLRALADEAWSSADLWLEAVQQGRRLVSEMEAAEEELFIANRRLVVRCVKPYFWIGQVWLADFLQEGSKALSNAIRKFDFTRGTPFYAYAQRAIQNRLRNYFRDHVRAGTIGMRPSRDMLRIKGLAEAWVKTHGAEPDADALARISGLTKDRVVQLQSLIKQWEGVPAPPLSLDALIGDSSSTLHELIEDHHADRAVDVAQVAEIWEAVDRLPERSRHIMRLRFVEGRTLEETGVMLNLTRARIKQIQDDALGRIRTMLGDGHRPPSRPRRRSPSS